MIDYLTLSLFSEGAADQLIASGYLAGNLGELGVKSLLAQRGADLALSAEYREQNLDFDPDDGFRSDDDTGQGGATQPVSGGYAVLEFFLEASIPMVEGLRAAEEVTLDLGYRYSDYDYGEMAHTFAVCAGWALDGQVKLRGSFQRALRALTCASCSCPKVSTCTTWPSTRAAARSLTTASRKPAAAWINAPAPASAPPSSATFPTRRRASTTSCREATRSLRRRKPIPGRRGWR